MPAVSGHFIDMTSLRGRQANASARTAIVGTILSAACLLAPSLAHADTAPKPVLTCKMEVNQYYPDNNGAFENILLDTGNGSVTDGNGVNKAVLTVDNTKYQFHYQFNKMEYTYIVFRTTGAMDLIHKFPVDKQFVNGTHYKCELFNSKPKF